MIAKMFPLDATKSAVLVGIPSARAATKATSELKGSMVAARNAEKKRASSMI